MIKYRKGYKYQLAEDYVSATGIIPPKIINTDFFALDLLGNLTLKKGYATDGPSGPTIDTKNSIRAAFEHDAFYQMMRMGLLPASYFHKVNLRFRKVLLDDGMCSFRANYWYSSVERHGKINTTPERRKVVYTAP